MLDAQRAPAQGYRLEAVRAQQLDLVRGEAALGTECDAERLAHGGGARRRCERMRDQRARPRNEPRDLVLDEGPEATALLDRRHDGVAALLEAEHQLGADRRIGKRRTLPEALLDPPGVEQHDAFDAHRRDALQDAAQHFGARQRQQDCQWRRRRRVVLEGDVHYQLALVERHHRSVTDAAAERTDAQRGADLCPMHVTHVRVATPHQAHPLRCDEVILDEKNAIHASTRVGALTPNAPTP